LFSLIFYAFPYCPVLEEIWRRGVGAARNDLYLILLCVIRSIVAMLNVKRHARGNGRRRSCQSTVTTEQTRQRHKGSGGAETRITGSSIARGIRPTGREIVFVKESGIGGGDPGQGLQRWTS
jgi:hypothetical protein